jgi:hypothetical protein
VKIFKTKHSILKSMPALFGRFTPRYLERFIGENLQNFCSFAFASVSPSQDSICDALSEAQAMPARRRKSYNLDNQARLETSSTEAPEAN